MTRRWVKIAIGAALLVLIALGVVWQAGLFLPKATSERPAIADTPPLPPVATSSLIVAPIAIRLAAIQDAVERAVPRNLAAQPGAPALPNIPGLKMSWSLDREPFVLTGSADGLQLSSTLRGSVLASGELPIPGGLPIPGPLGQPPDDSQLGIPDMPKEMESQLRDLLGPLAPPAQSQTQTRQPPSATRPPAAQSRDRNTPEQRVEISGQIIVTVRPSLGEGWQLEPNLTTQVTINDARFSIMGTTTDVTDETKRLVESTIEQQVAMLQAQIGKTSLLQDAIRSEWDKMCRSVPMGDGPPGMPNLWLEMRPTQAMAAQPRIDANSLTLTVGVRAETRIQTSETKPACTFPSRLEIVPQMDQGQINIDMPVDIPFTEFNRMIQEQVKGQTFPLDESGAFIATVNGIEITPSGDRLLMSLAIKAKETKTVLGLGADAMVYVWGRPVVDRRAQKVRFKDVAVDVKSDAVFGALGFAARAAVPSLQKTIAENAEIDLAPMVADARKNIEASIAEFRQQSDGVELDADVMDVALTGIQFDAKTLRIITSMEGSVKVAITKLKDQ